MTTDELNAIVKAVMNELEKAGVDFDFKAETPQADDLVYVMRGTTDKYQGITVKWQNLLDLIVKKATDAKNEAVSAKDIALQTLATIQSIESNVNSMKSSVDESEANVASMKASVEASEARVTQIKTEAEQTLAEATQTVTGKADKTYVDGELAKKADITYVDGKLANKADKSELAVERARIDSLSTLPEGSTTGDAELIGIRIGADGVTYPNAGEAVRTQISDLNGDLADIRTKEVISPINKFDKSDAEDGFIAVDGAIYGYSGYYHFDLDVERGDIINFYVGLAPTLVNARVITAYDSTGNAISSKGAENISSYTTPDGISKIVVTTDTSKNTLQAIVNGDNPTEYNEYFAPYTVVKINGNVLPMDSILSTESENPLQNKAIASVINAINSKLENVPTTFGTITSIEKSTMAPNETLTVQSNIDNRKNSVIEFWANVLEFESVIVGHGYRITYGNYVVVDNTNVTVYYNTQQIAQYAHGLTIDGFIHVVVTQGNNGRGYVRVTSANGTFQNSSSVSWDGCRGDIFAISGSTITNCKLTSVIKDLNEDVFFFGDSYTTFGDPSRWVKWVVDYGYTSFLVSGFGGAKSEQEIISFDNIIDLAKPKYAVWCLGMNDADTSNAINSSWQNNLEHFIYVCENNGIIPILATIPNTPVQNNMFKNDYVRSSGYRYVDFAKAVGAESIGSSWYDGMLYSDNVHPTELGAKALASRVLMDVPEIIK